LLYFVVKYANIFYLLSCKDLSDRIRKFTPTVFFYVGIVIILQTRRLIPETDFFSTFLSHTG
jgi:hypothetical protein